MRMGVLALVASLACLTACSSPEDDGDADAGSGAGKIREITEQQLCDLVPRERVGQAFDIKLQPGEPDRSTETFLGKQVRLRCEFENQKFPKHPWSVTLGVMYHYNKDPLNLYLQYAVSDDVKSERVKGLADAAVYYPDGPFPESLGRSQLEAYTRFDDGIRYVEVSVDRGAPVAKLKPVVQELLKAIDAK